MSTQGSQQPQAGERRDCPVKWMLKWSRVQPFGCFLKLRVLLSRISFPCVCTPVKRTGRLGTGNSHQEKGASHLPGGRERRSLTRAPLAAKCNSTQLMDGGQEGRTQPPRSPWRTSGALRPCPPTGTPHGRRLPLSSQQDCLSLLKKAPRYAHPLQHPCLH